MYRHSIYFDRMWIMGGRSDKGFIADHNPIKGTTQLSLDIMQWLKDRPCSLSVQDASDAYWDFYLNFYKESDMLLFKLTWGGNLP